MKKNLFVTLLISILIFISCSPKSRYDRRLKKELESGIRYDSIFMGFYFGMPEKEFYLHCWNLNKKGYIKQGETNTTVEYEIKNELKYPGLMNFYPDFNDGKISEMPVRFKYKGWSPWNKDLSSEKLQEDVLAWYKKKYGSDFMKIRHPSRGTAYVKLNGNRRITIFKQDELYVWAIFSDMLTKRSWTDFDRN